MFIKNFTLVNYLSKNLIVIYYVLFTNSKKNPYIPKLKIIKILLYQILICGYKYFISIYIWLVK